MGLIYEKYAWILQLTIQYCLFHTIRWFYLSLAVADCVEVDEKCQNWAKPPEFMAIRWLDLSHVRSDT